MYFFDRRQANGFCRQELFVAFAPVTAAAVMEVVLGVAFCGAGQGGAAGQKRPGAREGDRLESGTGES